jgi:hypothetical protein
MLLLNIYKLFQRNLALGKVASAMQEIRARKGSGNSCFCGWRMFWVSAPAVVHFRAANGLLMRMNLATH